MLGALVERSAGASFFCENRGQERARLRRGRAKTNRDFGDFKGLDSVPRRAPPENGKNMRRLTTEGRNAFAPMFPHEMRNKNNPMRRNAAWGWARSEHAPERRNFPQSRRGTEIFRNREFPRMSANSTEGRPSRLPPKISPRKLPFNP